MSPSQTINDLTRVFLKQRDDTACAGGLVFDEKTVEAVNTGKVVLCGHDPVLTPLSAYWLIRTHFSIIGVSDDAAAGERRYRQLVLASFELATQAPKTGFLLNCASNDQYAYETFKKVAAYIGRPIVNPQQLALIARAAGKKIQLTLCPDYFVTSILAHSERFLALLPCLDDEVSQEVLLQVLMGRLTTDFDWFWQAYSPVEDMYFPDFFNYSQDEIFVDAGAFDAKDTLRFLRKRQYRFKACHLFEIAPANVATIERALDELGGLELRQRIHVVPQGLWDQKGCLQFCSEGLYAFVAAIQAPAASTASASGVCDVIDLDSAIDSATLIKFEIEGAEMRALHGARRILTQRRPKLAISAYHLSNDIFDIIEYLRGLDLGYKFRVRHHWGSDIRTLIYAATDFK